VRVGWRRGSPYLLAGLLTVSGVSHFVATDAYATIVPSQLPAPRALVYASGLAELGCAAGLVVPATRRVAGWLTAALFIAVFPANVEMALERGGRSAAYTALVLARLPVQLPLIWWAVGIGRGPGRGSARSSGCGDERDFGNRQAVRSGRRPGDDRSPG